MEENVQLKNLSLFVCFLNTQFQSQSKLMDKLIQTHQRERERESAHRQTARKKERKEGRKKEYGGCSSLSLSVSLCALLFCVKSATTQSDCHTCICAYKKTKEDYRSTVHLQCCRSHIHLPLAASNTWVWITNTCSKLSLSPLCFSVLPELVPVIYPSCQLLLPRKF